MKEAWMWRSTILSLALNLLVRAMVPGAEVDKDREILLLQEGVAELLSRAEIVKEMLRPTAATGYFGRVRLMIIFHITSFDVPRRRVSQVFGIARSTLYRWLERIDGRSGQRRPAWNRTPTDLAWLVWEVARVNLHWGRVRIVNQLRVLGIQVSPSTVRNILNRPKPPSTGEEEPVERRRLSWRSIPAFHANHLWSADVTRVLFWGLWPVDVLVIIH